MNLQQIIYHDAAMQHIVARLAPLLEPDLRSTMEHALLLSAEVRLFAVGWTDAVWTSDPERIAKERAELVHRLVQMARPD